MTQEPEASLQIIRYLLSEAAEALQLAQLELTLHKTKTERRLTTIWRWQAVQQQLKRIWSAMAANTQETEAMGNLKTLKDNTNSGSSSELDLSKKTLDLTVFFLDLAYLRYKRNII